MKKRAYLRIILVTGILLQFPGYNDDCMEPGGKDLT